MHPPLSCNSIERVVCHSLLARNSDSSGTLDVRELRSFLLGAEVGSPRPYAGHDNLGIPDKLIYAKRLVFSWK